MFLSSCLLKVDMRVLFPATSPTRHLSLFVSYKTYYDKATNVYLPLYKRRTVNNFIFPPPPTLFYKS